jgi:hypothetical protein
MEPIFSAFLTPTFLHWETWKFGQMVIILITFCLINFNNVFSAVSHVINSLNLGSGAVHRISSFSQFNENFLINALLTTGVDM